MPGPVRFDKKGRVKKSKPKVITGSGSRALTKAEQNSPRVATYSPRKTSPKPPKAPKARRSLLATPEVQSAVERLRSRYADSGRTVEEARRQTEANVRQREARVDDIAAAQVQPDPTMSRADFIGQQNQARQNTALSSDGKTVKRFRGKRIVGTPSTKSVAEAAREGSLRGKKRLTTPEVRQTKRQVRKARRQVRRARAAVQTPRKNLMRAGLDPEQARILTTVLKTGRKMGATRKELLAATMTALVESNISNPTVMTDHDSLGWRQERVSQYGTKNALDVRGGAKRFFEESVSDTGGTRGRGMLAGDLAQTIQGSAYPDRYEERRPEATALLRAFSSAGNASPKAKRRLNQAKERAGEVAERAANLGLSVQGLVTPEQVRAMGIKPAKNLKRPTLWAQPKRPKGKASVEWLNGTTPEGINPDIIALARTISRTTGLELQITSALRPTDYDSNHSEGGALDINALAQSAGGTAESEAQGDAIAYAAVIAAGGSEEDAQALASGAVGYVGFVSPNGQPVEFLWKGDGDHRDHVHMAVEEAGARGEKVFRGRKAVNQGALSQGFPSSGGTYPSSGNTTTTISGGVASGPTSRIRRQATILDTLRRPEVASQLRQMGFRVTANGIFRANGENLSQTEFAKMKERFGIK